MNNIDALGNQNPVALWPVSSAWRGVNLYVHGCEGDKVFLIISIYTSNNS